MAHPPLIEVVRRPGKEHELLLLNPLGQAIAGVSKIELVAAPRTLPTLRVEFMGFTFLGETFPTRDL